MASGQQTMHRDRGRSAPILFAVIAALMAIDVTIEFFRGVPLALQSFEVVIFLSALTGIVFHWRQMTAERDRSDQLDRELAQARAEVTRWAEDARRWNREAQPVLQRLGETIDRQFQRWGLTDADKRPVDEFRTSSDVRRCDQRAMRSRCLIV